MVPSIQGFHIGLSYGQRNGVCRPKHKARFLCFRTADYIFSANVTVGNEVEVYVCTTAVPTDSLTHGDILDEEKLYDKKRISGRL